MSRESSARPAHPSPSFRREIDRPSGHAAGASRAPVAHASRAPRPRHHSILERLPVELSSYIFLLAIAAQDRQALLFPTSIASVNRHCRRVALATKLLWTHLTFTSPTADFALDRLWLARSAPAPLSIVLDLRSGRGGWHEDERPLHTEAAIRRRMEILAPAFARCRMFRAYTDTWNPMFVILNRLRAVPAAPLLEVLELVRANEEAPRRQLADILPGEKLVYMAPQLPFAGETPALRELVLSGVHLGWTHCAPMVQGLTYLDLSFHAAPLRPPMDAFRGMLAANAHTLGALHMCGTAPRFGDWHLDNANAVGFVHSELLSTSGLDPIVLPALKRLHIGYLDPEDAVLALSEFYAPNATHLTIEDSSTTPREYEQADAASVLRAALLRVCAPPPTAFAQSHSHSPSQPQPQTSGRRTFCGGKLRVPCWVPPTPTRSSSRPSPATRAPQTHASQIHTVLLRRVHAPHADFAAFFARLPGVRTVMLDSMGREGVKALLSVLEPAVGGVGVRLRRVVLRGMEDEVKSEGWLGRLMAWEARGRLKVRVERPAGFVAPGEGSNEDEDDEEDDDGDEDEDESDAEDEDEDAEDNAMDVDIDIAMARPPDLHDIYESDYASGSTDTDTSSASIAVGRVRMRKGRIARSAAAWWNPGARGRVASWLGGAELRDVQVAPIPSSPRAYGAFPSPPPSSSGSMSMPSMSFTAQSGSMPASPLSSTRTTMILANSGSGSGLRANANTSPHPPNSSFRSPSGSKAHPQSAMRTPVVPSSSRSSAPPPGAPPPTSYHRVAASSTSTSNAYSNANMDVDLDMSLYPPTPPRARAYERGREERGRGQGDMAMEGDTSVPWIAGEPVDPRAARMRFGHIPEMEMDADRERAGGRR